MLVDYSIFKVGDKVICTRVHDFIGSGCPSEESIPGCENLIPIIGKIYTVSQIHICFIALEEIPGWTWCNVEFQHILEEMPEYTNFWDSVAE